MVYAFPSPLGAGKLFRCHFLSETAMRKQSDFGALLEEMRRQRRLTPEHLARNARVTTEYLLAIESSRCEPPRPITIMRLCRALALEGGDAERLHRLADEARDAAQGTATLSRPARQLVRAIERYSPALPDRFLIALRKMVQETAER